MKLLTNPSLPAENGNNSDGGHEAQGAHLHRALNQNTDDFGLVPPRDESFLCERRRTHWDGGPGFRVPGTAASISSPSGTSFFIPLQATLLLADGTTFHGHGAGHPGIVGGELVFTTAMTGYQEALTDPSYRGQILMFTYPLIGNYGTATARAQSSAIQPRAVIMATLSDTWGSRHSLRSVLERRGIPTLY